MTTIEWTDEVWNPVTGCTKVSPGCKHCYAEGIADRFFAKQYPPNPDGSLRKFTDVRCHPERLEEPLHWKKPRRVFVNSMSDLFHEDVPNEFIVDVFRIMETAKRHTFQILTKRPERMLELVANRHKFNPHRCPSPNVWLGVSVENQKYADERIPLLLQTPAAIRFISAEPLLEQIDLTRIPPVSGQLGHLGWIAWVICGGESGPGARPMHLEWADSLQRQCQFAATPFFFKQGGSNCWYRGQRLHLPGKGGELSQLPEHLRVREFPDLHSTESGLINKLLPKEGTP